MKKAVDIQGKKSSPHLSWEAEEFFYHRKGWLWTAILIMITLIIATGFLWLRQYFSATISILLAIVVYRLSTIKPKSHRLVITNQGIDWGERHFDFRDFKSFWLTSQIRPRLYMERLNRWLPPLTIELNRQDPQPLTDLLRRHLPQQNRQDDLLDKINQFLKI